jgi:hypothetical protein
MRGDFLLLLGVGALFLLSQTKSDAKDKQSAPTPPPPPPQPQNQTNFADVLNAVGNVIDKIGTLFN